MMEPSKGFVPEREESEHLRNAEGSFHILLQSLQALPRRFGLRRLCPQPHSRKFRRRFLVLSLKRQKLTPHRIPVLFVIRNYGLGLGCPPVKPQDRAKLSQA